LTLGTSNNLNTSDELCSFIDRAFESLTGNTSSAQNVIDQIIKYTMSAKMRAVRYQNREEIKFYNSILKNCKNAKKYIDSFAVFFKNASSLKDCLKIIIRAMEPLQTFTGAEEGLQTIYDNSNGLSPGIKAAILDILTMLRDIESTFIINLKNSNSELFGVIIDLGQQMFDKNVDDLEKKLNIIFGKHNVELYNEFKNAQDFIWSIAEPHFPADRMLDEIQPAYSVAMLENGIHRVIFENLNSIKNLDEKSRNQFIQAFRVLLLTECTGWDKQAAFFSSLPPSFNMNDYANQSRQLSQNCFYFFNRFN